VTSPRVAPGLGWPHPADDSPPGDGLGWPTDDTGHDTGEPADNADNADNAGDGIVATDQGAAAARPVENSGTPIADAVARDARDDGPRQPQQPIGPPAQTRVLVVANQKGGVGKTTTAVNIAAALAAAGLRVLVVDLDPQGNASTALALEHGAGTPGIYEVVVEGRPIRDVLVASPAAEGLFGVAATIDLAGAEIELVPMVARESRLRRALDRFLAEQEGSEDRFDFVFIDCPPSLGLLTINAFVAGREVLIPIQCEYYALEGLGQLMKNIELVKEHLNPALSVSSILLTMYDGRTRLASGVAEEVRRHFGPTVLATAVPRSVRISEAPSYGQTVITYDPASAGARAYLSAARELAMSGSA
jgi:chromosome partitioning protein